jgi:biopolymer transport protein ExbB
VSQPVQQVVIDSVLRASRQSAANARVQMQCRVNQLATIASVAPLLGLLITVEGIVSSFVGCGGGKWTCLAAVVERLSYAFARAAAGLAVAILALVFYRYLRGQIDDLAEEMEQATLALANELSTNLGRRAGSLKSL